MWPDAQIVSGEGNGDHAIEFGFASDDERGPAQPGDFGFAIVPLEQANAPSHEDG
jgi:hypothetical protein